MIIKVRYLGVAVAALFLTALNQPLHADLIWENTYSDNEVIANGQQTVITGNVITYGLSAVSDNDSGGNDLSFGASANYFYASHGELGGHDGFFNMVFDNTEDDPADYLEASLSFQNSVDNLQFSLLDLDSNFSGILILGSLDWHDAVEVFYNGSNIATATSTGSNVQTDNESYMTGYESNGNNAAESSTIGNLAFDFTGTAINDITIRYRTTDDAKTNPDSQRIGISDLSFVSAVPEPSSGFALLGTGLLAMRRRRR